jgi:hypothetical protein
MGDPPCLPVVERGTQGREEGLKDRPCLIVDLRQNADQDTEVFVAPITHTPPEVPEKAIAIPQATKARLGLDAQASWVITTEVNRFIWPGPDIRTVPRGGLTYGHLPADMTRDVVEQIKANAGDRSLLVVGRDETAQKTKRPRPKPKKT